MTATSVLTPSATIRFKALTCLPANDRNPLGEEIQREVADTSLLETTKRYMQELHGSVDNNARAFQKLAYLFDHGITPTKIEGHYDGVAIGLRTGDQTEPLASFGNLMGKVWGTTVGPVAP